MNRSKENIYWKTRISRMATNTNSLIYVCNTHTTRISHITVNTKSFTLVTVRVRFTSQKEPSPMDSDS